MDTRKARHGRDARDSWDAGHVEARGSPRGAGSREDGTPAHGSPRGLPLTAVLAAGKHLGALQQVGHLLRM